VSIDRGIIFPSIEQFQIVSNVDVSFEEMSPFDESIYYIKIVAD
jgi:hypothetical protein